MWSQWCEHTHTLQPLSHQGWAEFLRRAGQLNICSWSAPSYPNTSLWEASQRLWLVFQSICIYNQLQDQSDQFNLTRWDKATGEKDVQITECDAFRSKQALRSCKIAVLCFSSPIKVDWSLRVSTVVISHNVAAGRERLMIHIDSLFLEGLLL